MLLIAYPSITYSNMQQYNVKWEANIITNEWVTQTCYLFLSSPNNGRDHLLKNSE